MGRFRLKKNLHVGITSSGGDFVASQILSLNNSRENNFKIFSFNENMNYFSFQMISIPHQQIWVFCYN